MIRRLTSADIESWREIRFEALKLHPEAFGSTFEEEVEQHMRWIEDGAIFGAFEKDNILGVAGFFAGKTKKTIHKGNLYGVYVRKDNRGKGVSDELIKAVLDYAADKVLQIHCTVITSNISARKLYEKHGFVAYGTEPRALHVDGKFYDEHYMVKKLA